jgi:hypothetical protein
MITPTLYNEARFGYTHYPTRFDILETENMNQKFGVIRTRSSSRTSGLADPPRRLRSEQ